ncbi:hypothetical protein pdam_00022488 [Pocillopora damicornis]|uniref:Uncharacterized protein n=1 Tax=Pocillopora damicornis TaxID=46731 RepID=A0A3M6TN13_POCDA|nr:hypothetical protein pdam_00022488 [Pocillopora damicornis]
MRGFKLFFLNIASLPKHIDELRVLLSDNPLDQLSINETRLDDSVNDDEVYIPGYDIIRCDREHNVIYNLKTYASRFVNLDLNPFLLPPSIGLLIHQLRYLLILNPLLVSLTQRTLSFIQWVALTEIWLLRNRISTQCC